MGSCADALALANRATFDVVLLELDESGTDDDARRVAEAFADAPVFLVVGGGERPVETIPGWADDVLSKREMDGWTLARAILNLTGDERHNQSLVHRAAADLAIALHDLEVEREHDRYSAIVSSSRDPTALLDGQLVVLAANAPFATLFGELPGTLIGRDLRALLPSDLFEHAPPFQRSLAGESTRFEFPWVVPNLGLRELAARLSPCHDSRCGPATMGLSIEDVTDLRASDRRLLVSEARLSLAEARGRIGHWELDLASNRTHWSDMLYEIYGRAPELGPPDPDHEAMYYSSEDAARLRSSRARLLHGEAYEIEVSLFQPSGARVDVASSGSPIRDGAGKIVGFRGTVLDVTQRKQAETALQAERDNLRAVTSAAPVPLLVVDASGRLTFANAAAESLLGRSAEDLRGQRYCDLLGCGRRPELKERSRSSGRCSTCALRAMVTTALERPSVPSHEAEIELDPRVGQARRCLIVTAEPMTVDGQHHAVIAVQDITRLRAAEAARASLEEQLRQTQKMDAIGSLAGGIAHDFNNLLAVIRTYVGFALESLQEGDPLHDDLLQVDRAGQRAADLTSQLLAFGRKQMLQPTPLDLNEVVGGLEKMLLRILGEDIDLVRDFAPDLGVVRADRGQIEQVIMNLVVNARAAMPRGGSLALGTANLELEGAAARQLGVTAGAYVMLSVADSGCGMDAETRARIFEPFFTTKESGKGTGLGLSTAFGIIRQSGGHISVESKVGIGSVFHILLPCAEGARITRASSRPVPASDRGTETILVVEDEEAVRNIARRILEDGGFRVLTAANGGEALLITEAHPGEVDLVLTDVVMPHMSGRALVERLRQVNPALRVLYMSGYTDDGVVRRDVGDARTHFIGKPFNARDLRSKVRWVLDEPVV